MSVKMGRPTNDPKDKAIKIRLTHDCQRIVEKYMKQEGVSAAEAIRRGILKLEADVKKKQCAAFTGHDCQHTIISAHKQKVYGKSIIP